RPSGSVVCVGYQRPYCMLDVEVHRFVAGLKMCPVARPTWLLAVADPIPDTSPPATNSRPSGNVEWPEQNRFDPSFTGTTVKALVTGSQTRGSGVPVDNWSHASRRPSDSRFKWIDTSGHGNG